MIGLDFETYGSRDLTKVGLQQYVDDPLFTPLVAVAHTSEGPQTIDFINEGVKEGTKRLASMLPNQLIAAHNAGFERAVMKRIGIDLPAHRFLDTAVVSAYHGGGRSLDAAASQLLNRPKYTRGPELIKTFCIPGIYQEGRTLAFNPDIRDQLFIEWQELITYCAIDAELSYLLGTKYPLPLEERWFSSLTMEMNSAGWPIDMELVQNMQDRYDSNTSMLHKQFADMTDGSDLNLSSTQQMSRWCADRGVRASSFDEEKVDAMIVTLTNRLDSPTLTKVQREQYEEVLSMLQVRQELGGSSLKKLDVMLRQAVNGRMYDSYMHYGANATGRTTGRGVQMQNLPRLFGEGDNVEDLFHPDIQWDNRKLARNLRQVFRSSAPHGQLIVGDFSSVESRGLAWQAEEQWKLDSYRQGLDLYKVLASKIYAKAYDDVTKAERQVGKTGELSCGYGAGGGAVHSFAKGMGVDMTEAEAAKLVQEWRAANPAIVQYWHDLQDALMSAMNAPFNLGVVHRDWGRVEITRIPAPASLQDMDVRDSLRIEFIADFTFTRYIHGVQLEGRNITYHKPSERKTGDLWSNQFTDPKTKQVRPFTVYGGKLAGLLTQSLCRELFFRSLKELDNMLDTIPNVQLIGQFHDEIVVDWWDNPRGLSLAEIKAIMTEAMTHSAVSGFPLDAEIKSAHRYIK